MAGTCGSAEIPPAQIPEGQSPTNHLSGGIAKKYPTRYQYSGGEFTLGTGGILLLRFKPLRFGCVPHSEPTGLRNESPACA